MALEHLHHGAGQRVVAGKHGIHAFFPSAGQDLRKQLACLLRIPIRHRLVGKQLPFPLVIIRSCHARIAGAHLCSVVVGRCAVQLHDARLLLAERVDRGLQRLAHLGADFEVVKADIDVGARAGSREPVIVDHVCAGGAGVGDDSGAGLVVQVDKDQDLGAVGQRLLGLLALGVRVSLCVDDRILDAGSVQRPIKVTAVVRLPAWRRNAVGQQHGNRPLTRRAGGRAAGRRLDSWRGSRGCRLQQLASAAGAAAPFGAATGRQPASRTAASTRTTINARGMVGTLRMCLSPLDLAING